MPRARTRTTRPLVEELPDLLAERGLTLRGLAREIGVQQSYLSRIQGASDSSARRRPSQRVLEEIARILQVEPDYFAEYRETIVLQAIAKDPKLRDRVYDSLRRKS